MKLLQPFMLLACIVFATTMGCRGGGQIYQVNNSPIESAAAKKLSIEDVQKAIIGAGTGLGWKMAVVKPGEIIGTLDVRSHQAVVSIPHNASAYSILYKDSTNLKYNAEKQTIHVNYSGWVRNLDNAIRARLNTASQEGK